MRAGKYDEKATKNRTLIVELSSKSEAELLVTKAFQDKLGTTEKIYISPDFTKPERKKKDKS